MRIFILALLAAAVCASPVIQSKGKMAPEDECTTCQEVLGVIKMAIDNPDFDKELIAGLEQVCTELASFAAECKSLVDQYGPQLIQIIKALLADPKQVCTELGLCGASKEKIMAALIQKALPSKHRLTFLLKANPAFLPKKHILKATYPVKASAECILCEFIANKLDSLLSKNATQQEIIGALEKVCSILPSTLSSDCDKFIKEYGPAIIEILSQELNPKLICTTLGLCKPTEYRIAMVKQHKLVIGSNETCEICIVVMTYVKSLLKDNSTEEEIIKLLETVCNYLPAQLASECNAIVSEYGKEILMLIANSDPTTLCKEIGLCTASHKLKATGHQCFFGASYWCASPVNAVKCNALSFCKKHAWH